MEGVSVASVVCVVFLGSAAPPNFGDGGCAQLAMPGAVMGGSVQEVCGGPDRLRVLDLMFPLGLQWRLRASLDVASRNGRCAWVRCCSTGYVYKFPRRAARRLARKLRATDSVGWPCTNKRRAPVLRGNRRLIALSVPVQIGRTPRE